MKTREIVRLTIPYFKNDPRYFLVYKKVGNGYNTNYILLNITGKYKKLFIDPRYQHELEKKFDPNYDYMVINLNTLVLLQNYLLTDLVRKVKQLEEAVKITKKEFEKITKAVDICFKNKSFCGNKYEVRVK